MKKPATKKAKKQETEQEEDLTNIGFFLEPMLVDSLWSDEKQTKVAAVYAKGNYSYALEKPEGSETN